MRVIITIGLLAWAIVQSGCPCIDLACTPELAISLSTSLGSTLNNGHYDLVVTQDGQSIECSVTVFRGEFQSVTGGVCGRRFEEGAVVPGVVVVGGFAKSTITLSQEGVTLVDENNSHTFKAEDRGDGSCSFVCNVATVMLGR